VNANPTVLITGATAGIGLELARLYAQEGARLVLVGRRDRAELDDRLFSRATYCRADLARSDAPEIVRSFLAEHAIESLDLLVHNAAVAQYGSIADEAPQVIAEQVAVNVAAPVGLTKALAAVLERAGGKVVFVSSVVADLPCADFAVYAATKAALDGFARSLHVEWRGRIDVQVVHPGAVKTGFHVKASVPPELVSSPRIPSAQQAAAGIRRLVATRRRSPTLGFLNRLTRFAGRRLGRPMDWALRRSRA